MPLAMKLTEIKKGEPMADNNSNSPAPRPMTFTDVVTATRQTLELISDAANKVGTVVEAIQRHKGKKAAKSLDALAFGGDGSRRHLERIAAGQGKAEDFDAIAVKMDETGIVVEEAIDRLQQYRAFVRQRYGMALANKISDLVYAGGGKASIRLDLEHLVYLYDNFYAPEAIADEAQRILGNIAALNAGLEQVHDEILRIGEK